MPDENKLYEDQTRALYFKDGAISPEAFHRCYFLTFTDPFKYDKSGEVGAAALPNRNAVSHRLSLWQAVGKPGLAIDFTITKTIVSKNKKSNNTMNLRIYNIALENQKHIKEGDVVNFECGYNNDLANIFSGVVTKVVSGRTGPDTYANITATEMPAMNPSKQKGTLKVQKNTSIQEVCKKIGDLLIEAFPSLTGSDFSEVPAGDRIPRARVITGNLTSQLTEILSKYGMKWFIHNGIITAIDGEGKSTKVTTDITPTTGMVGSPQAIAKKDGKAQNAGKVDGWRVTSLLNNKLDLKDWVYVKTEPGKSGFSAVDGEFKIEKLVFRGNSFSGRWVSIVDAYQRKAPAITNMSTTVWRD